MRFSRGGAGSVRRFWHLCALAAACAALGCSASGSPTQTGSAPSGGGGPLITLPQDQRPSTPGAADQDWPSSACQGAIIDAVTGQYCQGPAYDPTAQTATLENDASCGTTLWGVARDFIGYQQMATEPLGTAHPDFGSHYCCGNPQGTVLAALGAD